MTTVTNVNGKREWCIKTTYPNGSIEYGGNLSRSRADVWARVQNKAWAHGEYPVIYQVVHISERDGEK